MNPFLAGLLGETLGPLVQAGGEIRGAFAAVGGDIARMRGTKRTIRGARKLGRWIKRSKVAKRAFRLFRPKPQRGGKVQASMVSRLMQRIPGIRNFARSVKPSKRATKAGKRRFRRQKRQTQARRINWGSRGGLRTAISHFFGSPLATAPGSGQAPAAPKIPDLNYSRMMADMANPNAYQAEQQRTQSEDEQQRLQAKGREAQERQIQTTQNVIKSLAILGGGAGSIVGAVGSAMIGLIPGFKRFTELVADSNRDLAPFSAAIAASYARMDIAKAFTEIKTARGTAGTTVSLNEAIMQFRDVMQPLDQDFRNAMNLINLAVVKAGTVIVGFVNDIAERFGLRRALNAIAIAFGKPAGPDPVREILQHIKAGEFVRPRARPLGKFN